MHTDSDPVRLVQSDSEGQEGRLACKATCGRAVPGLWMRGLLQIKAAREPVPF
jgi:hypothetical protein